MKNIITLQEIYEIDTISLQEKLQELESQQKTSAFQNLINLVKLELIEREKVQAFGRKLIQEKQQKKEMNNDERYSTNLQTQNISLLRFSQHESVHSQNFIKTIKSQTSRKNNLPKIPPGLLQKLKLSTTSSSNYVVIGKPSINHRYIPMKKKQVQKQKKIVTKKVQNKSKKQAYTVPRLKIVENQIKKQSNLNVKCQSDINKKNYQIQVPHNIKVHLNCQADEKNIEKQQIIQQIKAKEQNIQQKKQAKLQKIEIKFVQNDIYDDEEENQIFKEPQNLKQIQKMIDTEVLTTTSDNSYCQEINSKNKCEKQNQQSSIIIFNKKQDQNSKYFKKEDISNINDKILHVKQDLFEQENESTVVKSHQKQQQNVSIMQKQETLKIRSNSFKIIKKMSNSKNYLKQKLSTQKNQNSTEHIKLQQNCKIIHKNIKIEENQGTNQKTLKILQIQRKVHLQPVNFTKTNFMYSPILTQQLFPYHQLIPHFSRLFPHSKNLLMTLKNFQNNIKGHFQKNVFLYSKNDEYLSLHSSQLQFKTITQIQKIKKYSNLFDIDLASYYKKSDNILKRIKKTQDIQKDFDMLLYRVVRTKQDVYDIISSGFHRTKQWYELPHGMQMKSSWNLLWTWSKPQIELTDLFIFQKINHFFGNKQIARKDLLKKNIQKIKKMSKKLSILFDIIPQTYFLPGQNLAFIKKFRQYSTKQKLNLWILKPIGLSRGRGIQLVDKLQDVVFSQPIVLQKYLERPLLIQQKKFDMRIYVLVCSINPLQAYVYKEGFARLSTQKYTTNQEGLTNKFIHLTNYSVQKDNIEANQKQTKSFQQTVGGPKITLKVLKQKLLKIGIQWKIIQKQIDQIVLKSLIACMNSIPQNPNCFQLFGYDIIIDEQLKCWLLQVNSSPSLQKDFIIDEILKQQLIDDVIQVVEPIRYDRQRLKIIVQRRRKQAEGLKSHVNFQNNSIQQLNEDLNYILHGAKLKKYGQISSNINFKCLAPSQLYNSIVKAVQQTRIDPIVKSQSLYCFD